MRKPRPTLVCKASEEGVLIVRRNGNLFFPKGRKEPPLPRMSEEEMFIRYCVSGTKRIPPRELQRLTPEKIREIDQLHRKTMTIIVRMKEEVAKSWTTNVMRPFARKRIAHEMIIDNIRELQLDIDIPRPVLIGRLLGLQEANTIKS